MKSNIPSISVTHSNRVLHGVVAINGSKSISNRALIALALADTDPGRWLSNISTSKDTSTLQSLLAQNGDHYDAGDAGTTFRFLAAYLSTRPGTQTLTGSARMLERPIGPLADALRTLGADIQYLGKEGYPPLRIGAPGALGAAASSIQVPADVSSQFLSALLLIAPYLPKGLNLIPTGPLVSRPYLEMTIKLMRYFGADVSWQGESIVVKPGTYTARPLAVEADWSSASYWYALAVFAKDLDLLLEGYQPDSLQGDAVLAEMMTGFGIETTFKNNSLILRKNGKPQPVLFEQDFLNCPDIAQTLAVVCAGLGVNGLFSGLETLSIKETDRIAALKNELAKVGVSFDLAPAHTNVKGKTFYQLTGKAEWQTPPRFDTYGDHRMAMAFAAFGMLGHVEIAAPDVVAKSYPEFWRDLERMGFEPRM